MNRSELVAAIAAKTGQTQTGVNAVLDALFTTVAGEVAKGNKVTIPGWVARRRPGTASAAAAESAESAGTSHPTARSPQSNPDEAQEESR